MTAEAAQREPTMEEILASIRRIISEDDQSADELELKTDPAPAAPASVVFEEDSFEFDEGEADASQPAEDLMIMEAEPEQETPPAPAPAPAPTSTPIRQAPSSEISYQPTFQSRPRPVTLEDDGLVAPPGAEQAAGALGRLMGSMMISNGVTLDGVVRELLKPMLKDWLNANLPQLVETEVQKEIERIRRMAQ